MHLKYVFFIYHLNHVLTHQMYEIGIIGDLISKSQKKKKTENFDSNGQTRITWHNVNFDKLSLKSNSRISYKVNLKCQIDLIPTEIEPKQTGFGL